MDKIVIGNATLYNADMESVLHEIDKADCVLTDPPYQMLVNGITRKKAVFDLCFNENYLFDNVRRLLPDNGFIGVFGRGDTLYRWATLLKQKRFRFKEELVWEKKCPSNPLCNLLRTHELILLYTKKNGCIKDVMIDYTDFCKGVKNIENLINDIRYIKAVVKDNELLKKTERFLKYGEIELKEYKSKLQQFTQIHHGFKIYNDTIRKNIKLINGTRERSVIRVSRDNRYNAIHATQKPVELLRRILALISNEGDLILDPFFGSGSTAIAALQTKRHFIGCEKDPVIFKNAVKRIKEYSAKKSLI
jgi:site-specific DNA-methyltransferase (adenine-specific)